MKKSTSSFCLLICFCLSFCFAEAQNINLSNSKYWDGECYLAVNPKNPKHLVSAWIYFSTINLKNAIATRSSFDGGKTWTPLQIQPHVYTKFTSADPTMYFGKDSCVYLAWIDLSGLHSSDSGYIMVTRSVNGGVTWGSPVKAVAWNDAPNLPIDRPWIAADGSTGPYAGRVYLTTQSAYFTSGAHHPWFTYSADSGKTWAPIKQLDDSIPTGTITDATTFLTVSANGTLYGVYFSYYTPYSPYARLVLVKTYNGGATFVTHAAINLTSSDAIPSGDSLLKGGVSFTSNPTDTSNLVLLAPTNYFGQPDIGAYNSIDGGKTWNGPVRVNDDPVGVADTCHDLNWGGFANNGTYAAVWRDRRHTGLGDTVSFQIYGAVSANKGSTFGPNFLVSDSVSPPIPSTIVHGDDFLGCAVTDSDVYALWSDMRTGHENTFFNATSFSKIPTSILTVSSNSTVQVSAYPNPFHNETNIVVNSATPLKECTVNIYNLEGKKIEEMKIPGNGTYRLNLNSIASGTYLWVITEQGNIVAHGKWIVE